MTDSDQKIRKAILMYFYEQPPDSDAATEFEMKKALKKDGWSLLETGRVFNTLQKEGLIEEAGRKPLTITLPLIATDPSQMCTIDEVHTLFRLSSRGEEQLDLFK